MGDKLSSDCHYSCICSQQLEVKSCFFLSVLSFTHSLKTMNCLIYCKCHCKLQVSSFPMESLIALVSNGSLISTAF